MSAVGSASPMLRMVAASAAFATLYFVAAALTTSLIGDPGIVLLWPASGVYLGVMLVAPRHMWPSLACAAAVGSLAAYLQAGSSLEVSVAFAVPSSAEGLLGALLVERIAGRRLTLRGLRDLTALVVGGAVVATALVGLSAGAIAAQTFHASFGESWLRWWSADALGVIAVAPLIAARFRPRGRRLSRDELREPALVVAGVGFAVWFAGWSEPAGVATLVGGAIAFPFLLFAGWRWGPRAAALGGLAVALAATHFAPEGAEAAAYAGGAGGQAYIAQAFLAVLMLGSLAFAAAVGEERGAHAAAAESKRRLRTVMERLRDELGRANAELDRRRLARDEARDELDGTARELEEAGRRIEQLTAELAARSADVEHAGRTRERLAEDLRAAQAAGTRTAQELSDANNALATADQELSRLGRELALAAAGRDNLQSELDESARELGHLKAGLGDAARELARERARSRALEDELESAEARTRALEDEVESAGARTRALEDELENAGARTRALEAEVESAEARTRALEDEVQRAGARDRGLEDELESTVARGRALEDELESAGARTRALEDEVERVRAEQARTAEELAAAISGRRLAEQELEQARAGVDERERLERSLGEAARSQARAEAERRLLGDHTTELISSYDERGTCLYASPASRRLLGYEPEELVGRPGAELLHPDDRHRLARARATRSESTFEARLRRKADDYLWVEVTLRPVLSRADGRLVAMNTTVRDISERRAAAERVRLAEASFDSLFAALPTGSALLTSDGRIERANPALCRLTGYPRERLEGATLATLIHGADAGSHGTGLRRLAAGEVASLRVEQQLVHASGRTIAVELSVTPLTSSAGRELNGNPRSRALVAHFRDLTEHTRAHDEMRRLSAGQTPPSQTAA